MTLAHNLGFPRAGADRQLKEAVEAYRRGDLDQSGLRAVGRQLRAAHWQIQKDAGVELLPVGDFAWADQLQAHSLALGVIPEPFDHTRDAAGLPTLDTLLAMARSTGALCDDPESQHVRELTRGFGTTAGFPVAEFSHDQRFQLSWAQLFEEVEEAHALGHTVKPVIIGPLTYLWLGKAVGDSFDRLELLDRLLPVYGEIFGRLAAQGVEWVQIDEPILTLDLPQDWKTAFERAYHSLQYSPLKKLIATYFGGLEANLGLAATLPVQGLHIDLVHAPEQLPAVLDRVPTYKVLSLGVVSGLDALHGDLQAALTPLQEAHVRFGDNLWVAASSALLHNHAARNCEDSLEPELKSWPAMTVRKSAEIAVLKQALNTPRSTDVLAARA